MILSEYIELDELGRCLNCSGQVILVLEVYTERLHRSDVYSTECTNCKNRFITKTFSFPFLKPLDKVRALFKKEWSSGKTGRISLFN